MLMDLSKMRHFNWMTIFNRGLEYELSKINPLGRGEQVSYSVSVNLNCLHNEFINFCKINNPFLLL